MTLTPEHQQTEQIARALAEYAEQACRYVAKNNEGNLEDGPYRDGFETACEVCEAAILPNALRHIDRISAEIRPLIEAYTVAAIAAERERCAGVAYATCAESRHVTLGDKVAAAIRSQP